MSVEKEIQELKPKVEACGQLIIDTIDVNDIEHQIMCYACFDIFCEISRLNGMSKESLMKAIDQALTKLYEIKKE